MTSSPTLQCKPDTSNACWVEFFKESRRLAALARQRKAARDGKPIANTSTDAQPEKQCA